MSRKLNALEQKLHLAAVAADDKTITTKDLDAISSDVTARTAALNFLLSAGLLKMLKDAKGKISFKAVGKKELDVKKDLSNEESLVLSHIQASGNEGIWTKHLKIKTELHQTIIDRCLKSLTQKQLVKAVKGSVQHPTRKMYMLFHLEPSIEVTGGPWYTDKELDTEFIKLLVAACLKFINDRSFPRSKGSQTERLLYPISAAPPYPSATQIQTFLNKSRITETQLTVEHVETLLNVLIIDGEIEKVPAMGAALWESSVGNNENSGSESSSEEERKRKKKKRKRSDEDSKRKKKKRRVSESDSDADDSDDEDGRKSKKKDGKRRRDSDDSGSDSEDDRKKRKSKGKKKKKVEESTDSDSDTESEDDRRKRKSKSKRKRKHDSSSSSGSDSDADMRSRPRSKSKSRSKSRVKEPSSPEASYAFTDIGTTHVYRATHQERLAHFGWSQAPCGRCPMFDFCKSGGPVNPAECVYYGEWLKRGEVKVE